MARLRMPGQGSLRPVPPLLLVGRSPACGLVIDDPRCSSEHASIRWTGTAWELTDLGSRNGTYVSGDRIDPQVPVSLGEGARLGFGTPDVPYELVDAAAPSLMVVGVRSREIRAAERDLLVLPETSDVELTIFEKPDGGWVAEDPTGHTRSLRDQDVVETRGGHWQVQLPYSTRVPGGIDVLALRFRFEPSERARPPGVVAVAGEVEIPLDPRPHASLLWLLARALEEDRASQVEDPGWRRRDDLGRLLGWSPAAVDEGLAEGRRQVARAGIRHAGTLVELQGDRRRWNPRVAFDTGS